MALGPGANDEEPIDPIGEGFDVPVVASGRFDVVLEKSELKLKKRASFFHWEIDDL